VKEKIKEVSEAVDQLFSVSDAYGRGEIVPWAEIEKITGNRFENRARHIIGKWRRKLFKEREIVTLAAHTAGIRLLTHQEVAAEIPAVRQKKAFRQVNRALKETSLVDTDRLSTHQRKILAATRANMADTRRELFRSRKMLRNGTVKTETNPLRKSAAI
jgi:hypothetical protein